MFLLTLVSLKKVFSVANKVWKTDNFFKLRHYNYSNNCFQGCGAATKKLGAVSAPAPPSKGKRYQGFAIIAA